MGDDLDLYERMLVACLRVMNHMEPSSTDGMGERGLS